MNDFLGLISNGDEYRRLQVRSDRVGRNEKC